jgi:uncharacterized damage-inducible protein DinB
VPIAQTLLPQFDQEMAATRRVLERAPEAAFSWRPHAKSWTLGGICTHLAQIPHWGVAILNHDGYDLVRDAVARNAEKTTPAEVLATFDGFVGAVRSRLLEMSHGELQAMWSLRRDGEVLMSMPRSAAFTHFVVHHLIHHRGQLTVYLRLQDVPLPPIYGPTADESL